MRRGCGIAAGHGLDPAAPPPRLPAQGNPAICVDLDESTGKGEAEPLVGQERAAQVSEHPRLEPFQP